MHAVACSAAIYVSEVFNMADIYGACINPTTTIEALALRTADYLKGEGSAILG